MAIDTPAGKTSGRLKVGGRTFDLAGYGYHDHGWSTIKLPTFLGRWYNLRVYGSKYSIVLHKLYMTEDFGKGHVKYGLVGVDGSIAGLTRRFTYRPVRWRKEKESGEKIPTRFEVRIRTGGKTITGFVTEARFLDSLDLLSEVSWPVRMAIKAFYASPYLIRYLGAYELDVTDRDGNSEHISGIGVVETNGY